MGYQQEIQSGDLVLRGKKGNFTFRKVVPVEYETIETRTEVTKALGTDSRSLAADKAKAFWDETVAGWKMRLAGRDDDAHARFEAAEKVLKANRFKYVDVETLVGAELTEIIKRVQAVGMDGNKPSAMQGAALLGTVRRPQITVTEALELYWPMVKKDKTDGKSADQIRRWRNPRIKAVRNFVEIVGDKPLDELTRDDMLDFREWWEDMHCFAAQITSPFSTSWRRMARFPPFAFGARTQCIFKWPDSEGSCT